MTEVMGQEEVPTLDTTARIVEQGPVAEISELAAEVAHQTAEVLPANNEPLESLNDVERACLETMKEDFDRGIVRIDDKADKNAYQAALNKDKTAGQSWEAIRSRLLANKATLLKKAVNLSKLTGNEDGKGVILVGVYKGGELAIRQRSQEVVNARWTKYWQSDSFDHGELQLLFHPVAIAQKEGKWAKAVEILRAVKAAGYHVPKDAPNHNKEGLVAACEAVTGQGYVKSQHGNEWRNAILECPDNIADKDSVRVVGFNPHRNATNIYNDNAGNRYDDCGAVLWLRG